MFPKSRRLLFLQLMAVFTFHQCTHLPEAISYYKISLSYVGILRAEGARFFLSKVQKYQYVDCRSKKHIIHSYRMHKDGKNNVASGPLQFGQLVGQLISQVAVSPNNFCHQAKKCAIFSFFLGNIKWSLFDAKIVFVSVPPSEAIGVRTWPHFPVLTSRTTRCVVVAWDCVRRWIFVVI